MAIAAAPLAAPRADSKARLIAYWVFTILGPASFVMGGTMMLTGHPEAVNNLKTAGLPLYFATVLGFWKLAGAIVSVVPKTALLKEWAYAGFGILLLSASAMHLLAGDGFGKAVQPLMFLLFVLASYALRPASRRLVAREASA